MKKTGFTLAEVLITLMIIGVVATLTTPALVKNVGSSKIGPQLSKFVNTWETAMETMMMEESISNLRNADSSWGLGGMEKLSKYMIMTKLQSTSSQSHITFLKGDGSGFYSEPLSKGHTWQLKDGTILVMEPVDYPSYAYAGAGGAYKGNIGFMLVDIGGIKGSHRAGKEVFGFILDASGVLIPFGSNIHTTLNGYMPKYSCSNSSNDINSNFACTGAVADNGYKAPW